MTDNEIIKALELCANRTIHSCKSCPCNSSGCACNEKLNGGALDLINRQKAEIDRLKNELHGKVDYIHEQREVISDLKDKYNKKGLTINIAVDKEQIEKSVQECMRDYELQINENRNEAIKEFAEQLKKKTYPFPCAIGVENAVTVRAINDLVKEMTEDKNNV